MYTHWSYCLGNRFFRNSISNNNYYYYSEKAIKPDKNWGTVRDMLFFSGKVNIQKD